MHLGKPKAGLINQMSNNNYALAYLDEQESSAHEEGNASQGAEDINTPDESSNDPLHKNPQFQKAIRNWRSTEKELAQTKADFEVTQARLEALEQAQNSSDTSSKEAPDYWAKAYETKEQANLAWEIMQKHDAELMQKVDILAEEKAQRILGADAEAESHWINHIDNELNHLEETLNIDATSNSPEAVKLRKGIKKVWEEYSPTNENGELIFIPIEKAYDIYLKEDQSERGPRQQARRQAASLSTVRSYPNEAPSNVRPSPSPVRSNSKWSKLPWRSQMDPNS